MIREILGQIKQTLQKSETGWIDRISEIEAGLDRLEASKVILMIENFLKNIAEQMQAGSDELVRKAEVYISRNFSENLRVDTVADYVNLSTRQFIRRFQKATGMSYGEYLLKLRMETAAKLLCDEGLDLNEVCDLIGYQEIKYFKKLFKQYYGCSVREFVNNKDNYGI